MHFETKTLGPVKLRFYHSLPKVEVPACHNDLIGMLRNLKISKGFTECKISFVDWNGEKEEQVEYFGRAYTHPADQYNKEVGRELALQRAIEYAQFSPQAEREIWAGYFSR